MRPILERKKTERRKLNTKAIPRRSLSEKLK